MKPIDIFNKVQKAKKPGEHYTKTLKRLGITQKQYFAGRAAYAVSKVKNPGRKKGSAKAKKAPEIATDSGKLVVVLGSIEQIKELLG